MRSRQFWMAAFTVHLLVIAAVCCWDLANLIADGQTLLPPSFVTPAKQFAQSLKSISPWYLSRSNPVRQAIVGYSHVAGIESPYTFFAPNVPESLRVVFELQFPDKQSSYQVPHVQSGTEGLRLSALIDQAAAKPGFWRQVVLQMLAADVADRNPDATKIRVIVAALKFPSPAAYLKGAEPSYQFRCSYDFIPDEARQPDGGD